MDNRRVLLAIVLTFAVLALWQLVVGPSHTELTGPPAPASPAPAPALSPAPAASPSDTPPGPAAVGAEVEAEATAVAAGAAGEQAERQVTIRSDLYEVTLSNRGGVVLRWALRDRPTVPGEAVEPVEAVEAGGGPGAAGGAGGVGARDRFLPLCFMTGDVATDERLSAALYTMEGESATLAPGQTASVLLRWSDGKGTSLEKRLDFDGSSYVVGLEARGTVAGGARAYLSLGPGLLDRVGTTLQRGYAGRALVLEGGKVRRMAASSFKLKKLEELAAGWPPARGSWLAQAEEAGQVSRSHGASWAGVENNYFAGVLLAASPLPEVLVAPAPEAGTKGVGRLAVAAAVDPGGSRWSLFVGPKDSEVLRAIDPTLPRAIDFGSYGFFDSLARILLGALKFFYGYVRNYGLAIILLTVTVKLLFLPLTIKQLHAMQKMAKLRPQMKEIEARFEPRAKLDAAERLERNRKKNAEMMALYQREGINPASGCLPLLLQLPVLYALLGVIGASIELRHAPFVLWIQDLSAKDPLHVTPILMLISMMVMQAITPTAADPMQRRMMFIMPMFFAYIFWNLASGLGLYWLTQNVLSIAQQMVMNRWTQRREEREKLAKKRAREKG